ncbi:hypothetical protein [Lysinibacillus sp. C5.1]|uniref:hypothetical protein n=1 Tax=Lysinibacillus sp. C5.1 TaxID=2796169 RepID=UPI003081A109
MNLSEIISDISIVAITPIALPFIKMGVDSFNLKAAEKIFLSPSKRVSIFLSQMLLIDSLFFISIFLPFYFFSNQELNESNVYKIVIFTIIGTIIIFTLVFSLLNLLSVKFTFSFKDENNTDWEIERRISKHKILASNKNVNFKHFDVNVVMDKELKRELVKRIYLPGHKYLSEKFKFFITLFIFIIIICEFLLIFENIILQIIGCIVGVLSFLGFIYVICVKNNEELMKHYPLNDTTP